MQLGLANRLHPRWNADMRVADPQARLEAARARIALGVETSSQ